MKLLYYMLMVAGVSLLYLGHPNQAWLRRPLNGLPWRLATGLALVVGLACGLHEYNLITVILGSIAIAMLVSSVWPFLSLWRSR